MILKLLPRACGCFGWSSHFEYHHWRPFSLIFHSIIIICSLAWGSHGRPFFFFFFFQSILQRAAPTRLGMQRAWGRQIATITNLCMSCFPANTRQMDPRVMLRERVWTPVSLVVTMYSKHHELMHLLYYRVHAWDGQGKKVYSLVGTSPPKRVKKYHIDIDNLL